jgi:hypothetical protein
MIKIMIKVFAFSETFMVPVPSREKRNHISGLPAGSGCVIWKRLYQRVAVQSKRKRKDSSGIADTEQPDGITGSSKKQVLP